MVTPISLLEWSFGGNHDVKDVPTKKNKYEQRYYRLSNCGKFVRPVDRAPEPPSSHRRSLLTAVSLFLNLPSLRSDAPHIGRHLYHTYMFIFSTLLIATLYSSSFSAMAALWRRFPLRSSTRPLTATSRICWRYDLCCSCRDFNSRNIVTLVLWQSCPKPSHLLCPSSVHLVDAISPKRGTPSSWRSLPSHSGGDWGHLLTSHDSDADLWFQIVLVMLIMNQLLGLLHISVLIIFGCGSLLDDLGTNTNLIKWWRSMLCPWWWWWWWWWWW